MVKVDRQTFVDAGRKGGCSPKRKARIIARNKELRAEAQELLNIGVQHEQILQYLSLKYRDKSGYPRTRRQYRNIVQDVFSA